MYYKQRMYVQDVAERMAREARLLLFTPSIMPMDAYPIQQLPEEQYVVFVTSTTGQVSCRSRATEASTPYSKTITLRKMHALCCCLDPYYDFLLPPVAHYHAHCAVG